MDGKQAAEIVRAERKHLWNVLKDFKEEHGSFRPTADMFTVTQQVRHIRWANDWFREGAFGAGFSMDFDAERREVHKASALAESLAELEASYDSFTAFLESQSAQDMMAIIPPNQIMGEVPRIAVVSAQGEHTAHHRGALTVYLRLLGITPRMVYLD